MRATLISALLLTTSCGYHLHVPSTYEERQCVSVSPVVGEVDAGLVNAIAQQLARSPHHRYTPADGDLEIEVKVCDEDTERVGFRFDTDGKKRRKNLIGAESRHSIDLEVQVKNRAGKVVLGPYRITEDITFDYVDTNALEDTSFINAFGKRQTMINFSGGQLDSIEMAQENALRPLYERLAKRIVEGL